MYVHIHIAHLHHTTLCVCVRTCVCYTAGNNLVIEDYVLFSCVVHAYKKTVHSMCDWCPLVKTACTHSLYRHVIGVVCSSVWCLCVCKNVHIQVCVAHSENTPDASHLTSSSCRDWLLARHGNMDQRKLMLDQPRHRSIFCRCCALATPDNTLHQSSVVGYMCKTIQ